MKIVFKEQIQLVSGEYPWLSGLYKIEEWNI